MADEAKPQPANKKDFLFYTFAAIFAFAVFWGVKNWLDNIYGDNPKALNSAVPNQSPANNPDVLTRTSGDPNTGVEVSATYEKEKSQGRTAFQLAFNTHVVDYSSYNFQENIVLTDSQNKEYKATDITKQGGGHHQSIEIIFPEVSSPFKLIVKKLAGVPERVFTW